MAGVQRRPTIRIPHNPLKTRKGRKTRRRRPPPKGLQPQPLRALPFLHKHRRQLQGPPHQPTVLGVRRRPTPSRTVRRWLETFGVIDMWTHAIIKRVLVQYGGRRTASTCIHGWRKRRLLQTELRWRMRPISSGFIQATVSRFLQNQTLASHSRVHPVSMHAM